MALKNKLKLIAAITAVLVFFIGINRLQKKQARNQCSVIVQPKLTQKLDLIKNHDLLDTAVVTLNDKFYFLLTYMTGIKSAYNSTPVQFFPLNSNGKIESSPALFGSTQHVRSFSKIFTPWGEGVLMADHGVDGNEFSGGKLLLVVADKLSGKLIDKSSELHQELNFAFNAIAVRRSHKRFDDILVAPFNGAHSRVVYLKATDTGYVDASFLLPSEWRNFTNCFMTASSFDIDKDGKDEIALGSCDLDRTQNLSSHDRLLEWKNGKWGFAKEDIFPPRKSEATWGTVYWLKENTNLIALTHNKGFSKAAVQYFSYSPIEQKFNELPVTLKKSRLENKPQYFHKIQKFKDTFFTLIRYGSNDFVRPNLLAFSDQSNRGLKEVDVCLATVPNEVILGLDSLQNSDGKPLFFLTYYSGQVDVFE